MLGHLRILPVLDIHCRVSISRDVGVPSRRTRLNGQREEDDEELGDGDNFDRY